MKIGDRFYKLMAMTTSDSDNEALMAMRHANKMLKECDLTWKQVLDAAAAQKKCNHILTNGWDFDRLLKEYNDLVHAVNKHNAKARRGLFF